MPELTPRLEDRVASEIDRLVKEAADPDAKPTDLATLAHNIRGLLGFLGSTEGVDLIHEIERGLASSETTSIDYRPLQDFIQRGLGLSQEARPASPWAALALDAPALTFGQWAALKKTSPNRRFWIRAYVGADETFVHARAALLRTRCETGLDIRYWELWVLDGAVQTWSRASEDLLGSEIASNWSAAYLRCLVASPLDSAAIRANLAMDGLTWLAVDREPSLPSLRRGLGYQSGRQTAVERFNLAQRDGRRLIDLIPSSLVGLPVQELLEGLAHFAQGLAATHQIGLEVHLVDEVKTIDREVGARLQELAIQAIRNTIAHGYEPAKRREDLGKAAKGSLLLVVLAAGERTGLIVADDGRGVDRLLVADRAGVDQGPVMTDRELREVLASSGFSTRTTASAEAGLGIGLSLFDLIVKQALRGEWQIRSVQGVGTEISVWWPRDLSALAVLVCRFQTQTFAVPRCLVVDRGEIEKRYLSATPQGFELHLHGLNLPCIEPWTEGTPAEHRLADLWPSDICRFFVLEGIADQPVVLVYSDQLGEETCLSLATSATVYSRLAKSWIRLIA